MHSSKLVVGLIALTLFSACAKKGGSSEEGSFTVNGLSAEKGWCVITSTSPAVRITRLVFKEEKRLAFERIHLSETEAPVAYRLPETHHYVYGTTPQTRRELTVENVAGVELVEGLDNFFEQRLMFERHLESHPRLSRGARVFVPKRAIVVRGKDLLATQSLSFYPCDNFSKSLDEIKDIRSTN